MELQESLLRRNGGRWDAPPALVVWDDEHQQRARAVVEQFGDTPRWGFKDPRTLLTVDGWLELVPTMEFVGTFRHPVAVARSLISRGGGKPPRWFRIWLDYNVRLLELHDRFDFPLISFDQPPDQYIETLGSLAGSLGLEADAASEFFEKGLRTQRPIERDDLPLSVAAVLDDLRQREWHP